MPWHSYRDTLAWHQMTLSEAQHRACRYLEREGFRFLIDFGYANAIEKARQHWKSKKASLKSPFKPYTRPRNRL